MLFLQVKFIWEINYVLTELLFVQTNELQLGSPTIYVAEIQQKQESCCLG